jgi:hypothetical protein
MWAWYGGRYGAAMQVLRKEVLSAPKSFLALASLRHAVRLACFAAASLGGAAACVPDAADTAAGVVPAGAAALWGAEAAAATDRLRHTAAATADKRMGISFEESKPPAGAGRGRIALACDRTDEARMKLA